MTQHNVIQNIGKHLWKINTENSLHWTVFFRFLKSVDILKMRLKWLWQRNYAYEIFLWPKYMLNKSCKQHSWTKHICLNLWTVKYGTKYIAPGTVRKKIFPILKKW